MHLHPSFIDQLIEVFEPQQIAINLYRDSKEMHNPTEPALLNAYEQAVARYEWSLNNDKLGKTNFILSKLQRA
jgi:hypothetical protein